MVVLLALPVIAAVALAHRYLMLYAPSNVLIRRVRAARPTLNTVAAMLALAAGLIFAMKVLSDAVAAGAPGWLNLVVLVLAWDAIKIAALALQTSLGALVRSVRRFAARFRSRWRREGGIQEGRSRESTVAIYM